MHKYTVFLLASAAFLPQTAFAADAAAEADAENTIVVLGKGQTRQVQEVGAADIAILAPGSSPLKALEKLPSVNIQSADPFGAYEWSTRVTIRGFSQNQLGFTLDGIPLGDMTYGNHNGLHISRAASSDNIGRTVVSQGSGLIGTQSTNNLGGTLEFFTVDPADVLGLDASATYGSSNTMRGFARIALGTVDGVRGFASVQYGDAEKWKGDGSQRQFQVGGKLIAPIGGATLDAYVSYSNRAEQDYQDLSLAMIDRLGHDWDNFGPRDYALAIRVADIANNSDTVNNTTGLPGGDGLSDITGFAPSNPSAGTVFPAPVGSLDDAYYDASGLRRDTLASLGLTAPIGDKLTFRIKGYHHENEGQGTWATPYAQSPTGVPMAVRTTEYDINRNGLFASLKAEMGANTLTVGAWYEHNAFQQARRFYAYASRTAAGRDHLKFMRDPFRTDWDIHFKTNTFQYHVQDEIDLGTTRINLGWKGFKVDNKARAAVQGGRTVGDLSARDWFQPHIGVNQELGSDLEAFAGFSSVTRAYVSSTTSGPFSSTQAGFNAIKPLLKPEQSNTFEAGLRYGNDTFHGVLAAYYVDFKNRLLTIPTSLGIVGAANALQNVGSVRAMGIEATGEVKFGGWTAFASYSFNDNTYRDDVVINANGTTTVIATKGKTVVDSPRHLLHGEVAYDDDRLFGRLAVNNMSRRFFNYLNDRSVASRAIVDAAIGYRFDLGMKKPLEVQVNATNLFDKKYVSTIGSNGFGNSGDNQTLLAGAPRQFFVTLKSGF